MTVVLSMIVKNEAAVIARCLASVRPIIDHWIIVDTGSTDGTQDLVRQFFHDVPGTLHERPWQDFATNRNEALQLARPHGDYILIIDADDTLEYQSAVAPPALSHDSYMLQIDDSDITYRRIQLVRSALPWRWRGVLHEFIACEAAHDTELLPSIRMRRNHDGARRRSPETYRRDAAILEAALQQETDPFMRSRYTFYLAQSYRDCRDSENAVKYYLARAEMGYWDEERYVALVSAGRLMRELNQPFQMILTVFQRAAVLCPWRAEALHAAAQLCFDNGRNQEGFEIAAQGLELPLPSGGLFLQPWIYEYGLLDIYAINAYWAGAYTQSLDACLRLLKTGKLPADQQPRVLDNARFALQHLQATPPIAAQELGSLQQQHAPTSRRQLHSRVNGAPRVLLAILAKQKEKALPLYLDCLEALDYPKSSIVLYIRTNNNTDRTEHLLREWVDRVGHRYAGVEFDSSDVSEQVQRFGVHEWNATRFRVLGHIRAVSLRKTFEHDCAYYFVADLDNFLRPCTLRELVAANLPIVAPFLRHADPASYYSNYHADVDRNGYYKESAQYHWILNRWVRGLMELPVIHCTYLLRADILHRLSYQDESGRHEYVVFSESARKASIPQYFDNRQIYGYLTLEEDAAAFDRCRALLQHEINAADQAVRTPATLQPDSGALLDVTAVP